MKIHCLQHVPFEGPAAITEWATQHNHSLSICKLFAGETPPPPADYDLLLIMGGPMNIYEHDAYPWLTPEKSCIRSAIDAGKIVVGICLGAQLIADVLGASVTSGNPAEITWAPIRRHPECPSNFPLPDNLTVLHWHGDRFDIPAGAHLLASSDGCPNQGFLYQNHVLAWQCHLEVTPESVRQLIDACPDELKSNSPYVQNATQLSKASATTYTTMQHQLFQQLDWLTR